MILVDTSVWIEHFRRGHLELSRLLKEGEVAMHPMVLGELACGSLPGRAKTIVLLRALPRVESIPDEGVLHAIETHRWFSQGIGWIDASLLASALVARVPLWTFDERLKRVARTVGIGYSN